jgi:hypothetical protein
MLGVRLAYKDSIMAFEIAVEYESIPQNLREDWENAFHDIGITLEIWPGFSPNTWNGGLLPIKLVKLPEKYLFGLENVVQMSGFEVDFDSKSAHFRTATGRTIAALILQCYGAALFANIGNGQYYDVQTDESFMGDDAIQRAHDEIMAYLPYMDKCARMQYAFTNWPNYG